MSNEIARLLADVVDLASGMFDAFDWAEDEIDQALIRHPEHADAMYHGFSLLVPTHPMLSNERIFRAHCRELLDRLTVGADTRLGTAAEVICSCSETSKIAPLTPAASGLFGRMFAAAFPDQKQAFSGERQALHEALDRPAIDALEADARRRLTVPDRKLGLIECEGKHSGKVVACKFIPKSTAAAA